ncbi:TIR domain-containing protein [Agrococcus sp. Marseille-Q4369]|uniref:TIR domain-containing protein n=1 Tax=Agrococcus sp. Marseille-Q4369 TaxID=2810513 RepID=UPI001B8CA142|nr:TIR domain-containing protein [Agrococcus sp. Marseille-Q4369]QUW19902.1 TIR domain-containing protein [Agrococcus sp. Marseille-Q4369]
MTEESATKRRTYPLSEVFNEAGLPDVTYVPPAEAKQLKGSLATTGKHVTLVGPSGSGKSTVANRALTELKLSASDVHSLSGRSYTGASTILEVLGKEFSVAPTLDDVTEWLKLYRLVMIDDVHHLSVGARAELARYLKLWHEQGIRFFMIGIAKTAEAILGADPELAIRNDTWHISAQSPAFLGELMDKGEAALNIRFTKGGREVALRAAQGSPSIFQAICRIAAVEAEVLESQEELREVDVELPLIRDAVVRQYDGRYLAKIVSLARGRRQARSVHDTYYSIVDYVARSGKTQISQDEMYHKVVGSDAARTKSRLRNSFYRAMKNLPTVIEENQLSEILIFENGTLTIDDPVFRFYLDHLDFSRVRSQVNIRRIGYEYDVAVSFAGPDRVTVESLVRALEKSGLEVFYDFDEQAMLWGKDLRKELGRVYSEDAQFMIVCLSDEYPERDWTTFELEVGKEAAGKRTEDYLLPLIVGDHQPAIVGLPQTVGHLSLKNRSAEDVASLIQEKIAALPASRPNDEGEDASGASSEESEV